MQYRKSFRWDQIEKKKVVLNCSYNPRRNSISSHPEWLNRAIDEHSKTFDNFIFIGDFNAGGIDENSIKVFGINYLKCLMKVPIRFKNPDKPTYIGLILTNQPNLFQQSSAFETGLSDFHLSTVTQFKMGFRKLKPKKIV